METFVRYTTAIVGGACMGSAMLRLSPQPVRWKRLGIYLLLYFTVTMPSWVGDENPVLLFPFFLAACLLCLPGDKLPRLVLGGIFFTLLLPVNMLLDSWYRDDRMEVASMPIKLAVLVVLALALMRLAPKGGLRLSQRLWALLGGLTLGPLTATLSFSLWGYRFVDTAEFITYRASLERMGNTTLPFAFITALALLLAAVVLTRHEALEQENRLAALRDVYYTGLQQEQTQLRTLRHDLRNHVTALQGLLEQDKQADAARYLCELADSPALDGGKRYTENETANVVLSSKAAQMQAQGLIPDFQVQLPRNLSIPAPELCALLGNALDNAMEGAAGAADTMIALRVRVEKGVLMLRVQNAVGGEVRPDLSTTKRDAAHHGFGLAGMEAIARRHGGSMEAGLREGRFELLVCFACREAEPK